MIYELKPCPSCGGALHKATLYDGDYESKMDELLCRLTNGKFSKTRAYDIDFMESCVREEFEQYYAEELASAMMGRGTCHADETETIRCWVKTDIAGTERMELIHVMECSKCGHTYEHVNGEYEYCPRCGRRIEVDG